MPMTTPCRRRAPAPAALSPLLTLFLLLPLAPGCDGGTDPEYVAAVDAWHAGRIERLRSETGWLTLVGLHPLGQGANSLGSDPDNLVVLADAAPARLGTLTLTGTDAAFTPAADTRVHRYIDGRVQPSPFLGGSIRTDAAGGPDRLACGSLVFYVIQRGERHFLRVKDRESPVLLGFSGIDRYPVDAAWRVPAALEGDPGTLAVTNVLGQTAQEPTPGTLVFELAGRTCRLQPTGNRGEELFLVFGDETNGRGTYPGGRFLVVEPPAADGTYTLDFNRAYNPPCVFTEYATCPLPGPTNRLPVAVTAGEKTWGTGH